MNRILLLFVLSIVLIKTNAQVKKMNGSSSKPTLVNASDNTKPDFFPTLNHLDQHPIPSAEYGNKKEELNKLRAIREAELKEQKNPLEKKSRATATNPVIFKGIQGNTGGIPNDNDIAVSNGGKVVSVVNSNMRVYDDTGKVLSNTSLTNLVAPLGVYTYISDPRVIYDPVADRFILVCFSGSISYESTIIVGFTATNDPSLGWNFYTLNGNSFNDSTWSDYPIIAISDKDLFITFNQVKDNVSWTIGFNQSVIWQIDKQLGYSGTPLQYTLWSNLQYGGKNLRNICPAKYQSTAMGNNMYFLTLRNVASTNDSIFVTEITDSYVSGVAALQQKLLITPVQYGFPPNARQRSAGGLLQYLMTNDARVLAAVYENDYIHFGSNTLNPQYMNAGVYLGTIKNISTLSPIVTGNIVSSATIEYGYPSMTYVGTTPNDHRLLYTFSHCFTDSFPGTSILYKNANEEYSDIIQSKNGVSYINMLADSNERWGDYTQIQKMYNKPSRAYLSGSWGKSNVMNCWVSVLDINDWPLATSTIQQEKSNGLVFPNPVTEQRFTTKFNMKSAGHARFELYDMTGKIIYKIMDTYVKQGENEYSISTSDLSKGMYIFKISDDHGIIASHKISVE